jgi:hypothetical protein
MTYAPPPYRPSKKVRVRVEQIEPGRYAVTERATGKVVVTDFDSYTAAWVWIANNSLSARHD